MKTTGKKKEKKKKMKKILLSALCAIAGLTMQAQTSSEAIVGSCPTMPSEHNIAIYLVKGSNDAVKKYYQQLGEASRKASKAASQEFSHKNFAKEQANIDKKQKQIANKQAGRAEAGKRMMKFLETLTPAQRKKFESFRKEADAFQYLASIGKLDELRDLMEGVEGATGDETPVNQADLMLAKRDLSDELEAVNKPIFSLLDSLRKIDEKMIEDSEKAYAESKRAHTDNSGGKAGGLWDVEAVNNDMIAFWENRLKAHKKVLLDCMQAIRNSIPTAKVYDKKQNATRRMTGQNPLTAVESLEYAKAMEYLSAATRILPGDGHGSEISEMMDDNTQEIN